MPPPETPAAPGVPPPQTPSPLRQLPLGGSPSAVPGPVNFGPVLERYSEASVPDGRWLIQRVLAGTADLSSTGRGVPDVPGSRPWANGERLSHGANGETYRVSRHALGDVVYKVLRGRR